jgi:predicted transposase YbfD/YdcC
MVEKNKSISTIGTNFADLSDPRVVGRSDHKLIDILVIGICTVICGGDDYLAMKEFGDAKESWFRTFLELPNGIPSHATFWRVFSALDPEQFQACFLSWMSAISTKTDGEIIALDGKQLRRSHDREEGKAAIHMVSAWATENRLVLGQVKVDEKSNEITAIPELLRRLDISGCLISVDAMGCQVEIADLIIEQGGDYLFALKGNQSTLHEDVELLFDDLEESDYKAYTHDYVKTVDKGHGRIEVRHCWTISDPQIIGYLRGADRFRNLQTVIRVRSERYLDDDQSVEDRYFISSAATQAAKALQATRTHWQVENCLHWVLDIAFREDDSRIRKGHGAQNFAILRHLALNALKQETTAKVGVKNKRLKAGWDERYLSTVLGHLSI